MSIDHILGAAIVVFVAIWRYLIQRDTKNKIKYKNLEEELKNVQEFRQREEERNNISIDDKRKWLQEYRTKK
mgnify:CR=1 FL=1|tara:strand:- start:814 stop:1029 length:216 start_codon:yes stop_codon:yes gene_type:complete